MNKHLSLLAIVAVAMLSAWPVMAQRSRMSPHETISGMIDEGIALLDRGL